jgi:ribonuclease HI
MPVVECDVDAARERLESAGVTIESGNTEHERWRAEHGECVAVAYDDSVVVQGAAPHDVVPLLTDGGGGRGHVYFDGAARGNPGDAAIGWVVATSDGIVAEGGETIGTATNNQAEYAALVRALDAAAAQGLDTVDIRGDSELIVKQVRGAYDTNDPDLREQRIAVHDRLADFEEWSIEHVPRECNDRADELANAALEDAR